MKYVVVVILFFVSLVGMSQSSTKHITTCSQNDFKTGVLVDVRTPEEFAKGHLDGALNINWYHKDFAAGFKDIPKDKTIYLYCKKGGRSAKAQAKLSSLGFTNIVNLEGGYDAWWASKN